MFTIDRYHIYLFWNIGKMVYEMQSSCENAVKRISDYYSYYYGDSIIFTRENIHLMKKFYLVFPIFHKKLENISWKQYELLLKIPDKKERSFYFTLSLLFRSNDKELRELIRNHYYQRI